MHEITRFLRMFAYLWVLFGLLALHESILRRQMGLGYQMQGFAAINALVLAKVMLVAEDLNLGGEMRGRALIYGVLWEAAMFAIVFIVFHVLEELVVGLLHGSTLAQSVPAIGGGGFIGLLTVAVILFVALIPYFAFRDITRVLGREKMRALLFTSAGAAGENPTAMKSQPPEKAPEP